jgi:hypothetical protein
MRNRVWSDRTRVSAAGKYPSRSTATGGQSIHSQYRAAAELHTRDAFDAKHDTFNAKQRSK